MRPDAEAAFKRLMTLYLNQPIAVDLVISEAIESMDPLTRKAMLDGFVKISIRVFRSLGEYAAVEELSEMMDGVNGGN